MPPATLFEEIGVTTSKTTAQQARKALKKKVEAAMTDQEEETIEEEIESIPPETLKKMADIWENISRPLAISQDIFARLLESVMQEISNQQERIRNIIKLELAEALEHDIRDQLPDLGSEINQIQEKEPDFFLNIVMRHFYLDNLNPDQLPDNDRLRKAIIETLEKYESYEIDRLNEYWNSNDEDTEQAHSKPLPSVSHQKLKDIMYPLDKVNSSLWGFVTVGEETPLKAESDTDNRKGKQANIYILLDFDEIDGLKISRKLTAYDKRVFIAVANLAKQGHWITTAEQIYKAMGNKGRPNAATIEKILESVEILSRARVYIDNTEETKLYTKYEKIKGSFYLLATEQVTAYAKGVIVKDAIKILGIPQLLTFAENRGQVTTTPLALLESPMSQTEANLLLEDYLFSRIARMKNAKRLSKTQKTILIETIYQKCSIATYKQKQRLSDKIITILDHYKNKGWIKGFTLTDRSIDIEL